MIEPPQVPGGCQVIPLYRNVSGDNFHPQYVIVGYTIVDDADFQWISQDRWFMYENRSTGDYYAFRMEWKGGKRVKIDMAREILRLPRIAGYKGDVPDHKDHNTLNNSKRLNIRVATRSQSVMSRRKWVLYKEYKGVDKNEYGNKYQPSISVNGSTICFTNVTSKVEAAWMRRYGAIIIHDKFADLEDLPEVSRECRWELMGMVVEKLMELGLI
jgi:hypothetical protein